MKSRADDHIVDLGGIDVASGERVHIRRGVGVHIVHALFALDSQVIVVQILPQMLSLVGGIGEE